MSNAEVILLEDPTKQAAAKVLVSQGFNCFELFLSGTSGRKSLLWANDQFASGRERASSCGMPILFPFAGRIAAGEFEWRGKSYQLETNDRRGNAIHGFAYTRPWQVLEQKEDRVVGQFESRAFPELEELWPSQSLLEVTYALHARELNIALRVENVGDVELPFGLGLHPYFHLGERSQLAPQTKVTLPVAEQWELQELLPSGNVSITEASTNLMAGMAFEKMEFDDVFSVTQDAEKEVLAIIDSPGSTDRLEVVWDPQFDVCVLYTPGHREAVCIEPYSTLPDMFGCQQYSQAPKIEILEPGQVANFWCKIRISAQSGD